MDEGDILGIFSLLRIYAHRQYRGLDLQMMHLQRREVLWTALIVSSGLDDSKKSELITALGAETDKGFEELWLSRLTD